MKSNVNILYLTYNRLESTKLTLPNLLDSCPETDFLVHVHDNGSTDGTVDFLKSLDHPKLHSITYSDKNLGLSPVTNRFWETCHSNFLGKIDNDILVPKDWIPKIMRRLEFAEEDRIGPITMYHWIPSWTDDLNHNKLNIITTKNGSSFVRSSHTGGNYIMHRYLVDKYGPIKETSVLKGGFTGWQYQFTKNIKVGYVYPFDYFRQPMFEKQNDNFIKGLNNSPSNVEWFKRERKEAKNLLELPNSWYTR